MTQERHQPVTDTDLDGCAVETSLTVVNFLSEVTIGKPAKCEIERLTIGINVNGHVMLMFHSLAAIACNPNLVSFTPASFDSLKEELEASPGAYGHNGALNGMSGTALFGCADACPIR